MHAGGHERGSSSSVIGLQQIWRPVMDKMNDWLKRNAAARLAGQQQHHFYHFATGSLARSIIASSFDVGPASRSIVTLCHIPLFHAYAIYVLLVMTIRMCCLHLHLVWYEQEEGGCIIARMLAHLAAGLPLGYHVLFVLIVLQCRNDRGIVLRAVRQEIQPMHISSSLPGCHRQRWWLKGVSILRYQRACLRSMDRLFVRSFCRMGVQMSDVDNRRIWSGAGRGYRFAYHHMDRQARRTNHMVGGRWSMYYPLLGWRYF